jgi:magnesium chelatase family protein
MADLRLPPVVRRVAEIAAAGGHHMSLLGPSGSGASHDRRRLP